MSQITSRILVRVTSPQVWERFKGEYYEEVGGNFLDYIDMNFREFSIEDSWSCWPDDLETLVTCIAEILGKDGIIIADSDNINTDPTNFYAYYFGEKVHFGYLENKFHSGEMEEYDYYFDVCEIGDIAKWLNYGKYSLKNPKKICFCVLAYNIVKVGIPLLCLKILTYQSRFALVKRILLNSQIASKKQR